MPTTAERHALLFLAAVALVGGGVRVVGVQRFERQMTHSAFSGSGLDTSGQEALDAQIDAVESLRNSRSSGRPPRGRRARKGQGSSSGEQQPTLSLGPSPPSPDHPLNVNDATADELERLPRVGAALAQRILAYRDSVGPFGSVDDLRHVRGIGAATASLLAPLVTFDRRYRPLQNGSHGRPDSLFRLLSE